MNFDNLEYNLYNIVNCEHNENEKNIKKKIIKLLKFFHPDKNSKLEDRIYFHIITANEILLDTNKRQEYDLYLIQKHKDYSELINTFKTENALYFTQNKDEAIINFNKKNESLNKFHNYNNNEMLLIDNDYLNNIIKSRNIIQIEKNEIKSNEEFNKQFDIIKKQVFNSNNNNNSTEIIPLNSNSTDDLLLDNFNKLYIDNNNINTTFYL